MKILITGGSGFLGKHLTSMLKKINSKHQIVSISSSDIDLRISGALHKLNDIKFDKIYHLAAWTQAGDFSLYHSAEQWINNQLINSNFLNWWKENQRQSKIISIGTSCSYEEGSNLDEKDYLNGQPLKSLYAYGMTKRMLLIGQQTLAKQFGLKHLTFVPSTLYGPGYEIDGKNSHFIFDIILKILRAKKYNTKVELWGDGCQKREIVHVFDFINQMLILEKNCENEVVNIGAGKEFEIRHFTKIICDIVGYQYEKIIFNKKKFTGVKSKKLSIKKLKKLIPNYVSISLRDGLLETINYLEKKI